jgi:hypothetical protein
LESLILVGDVGPTDDVCANWRHEGIELPIKARKNCRLAILPPTSDLFPAFGG